MKKAMMMGGLAGAAALAVSVESCSKMNGDTYSVDQSACTGCGKCKSACSENAITVGTKASISSSKCVGCGRCARVCPENAISVD